MKFDVSEDVDKQNDCEACAGMTLDTLLSAMRANVVHSNLWKPKIVKYGNLTHDECCENGAAPHQ